MGMPFGRVGLLQCVVLLVLCLPACGKKAPPVPPPGMMDAQAGGATAEDVMLGVSTAVSDWMKMAAGLHGAEDVKAAEERMVQIITALESVADQSRTAIEPDPDQVFDLSQQRTSLQLMIDQYNEQADLIASDAATWDAFQPYLDRFDAALNMVELVPIESISGEMLDLPQGAPRE